MTRRGHVPRRTCAGCRARAPKHELLRVIGTADGGVEADPTGSAPGRGGYVHPSVECIDAALGSGARGLARALRTGVGSEAAGRLRVRLEQLREHM